MKSKLLSFLTNSFFISFNLNSQNITALVSETLVGGERGKPIHNSVILIENEMKIN